MKSTLLKMSMIAIALCAMASFDVHGLIPDDADGDGVPDSVDVCPGEDASGFDRDGDGCIDAFIGARHIEYWGTADATVTYVINATAAPNITNGTDITAIQNAVAAWTAIPNTELNVSYGGTTSQAVANGLDRVNLVTFIDNTYPFSSLVLAVGLSTSFESDTLIDGRVFKQGEIFDADMVFNPSKTYKTAGAGIGTDIQSIATHEAGHLWGISHSTVLSSTMFYALPGGTAARSLETDDELVYFKAYGDPTDLAGANRIEGVVEDGGTTAPVPGAIVFVINSASGDTSACDYTLGDGSFSFPGLPNGSYYVSIHPLNGTSPIGFIEPGNINVLIQDIAMTNFVPESYDAAESSTDDPLARTAIAVSGGAVETANLVTNIDASAPFVVEVIPEDGAPAVAVDGAYVIEFSEPLEITTVVASFTFRDNLTAAAKGGSISIVRDDSVLVFLPSPPLDFSRSYTLTIDTDLEDKFGNPLASDFTLEVTTEPEPPLSISSLAPSKGIIGNTVVINGRGFDATPTPTVKFGDIVATVQSGNIARLVVTVPGGAITGPVTVTNADMGVSNSLTFTVLSSAEVARGFDSGEVALGEAPNAIVVVPSGDYAYAATDGGAEAVVVSSSLGGYLTSTSIDYPSPLTDITATPTGTRVYAVSAASGELVEIMSDPTTGQVFNTVLSSRALGAMPKGIVCDPTGDRIYIATDESAVQVWDIRLGSPTYQQQVGLLSMLDGATLAGPMAVTPDGERLVVLTDTGALAVFGLQLPVALPEPPAPLFRISNVEPPATVQVGGDPRGVSVDPQGERAYVSHDDGDISVVNIEGSAPFFVQDIVTGGALRGLAITPGGLYLYAADRVLDNVKIVDLDLTHSTFRSVVEDVETPVNPVDVVISPDGFYAFTVLQGSNVLSPRLVVTTIGLGPAVASLYPLAGKPGTKVILSGNELGDIGDQVSVDFNGTVVPADAFDHVEVVATVPAGMTSGPVRVIVHNADVEVDKVSNSLPFEVIPNFSNGGIRFVASMPGAGALNDVIAMRPQGDLILAGNTGGIIQAFDIEPGSPTFHTEIARFKVFESDISDIAITADGKTAFAVSGDDLDQMVPAIDCDPNSPTFGKVRSLVQSGFLFATPSQLETSPDNKWMLVHDTSVQETYLIDATDVSTGSIPAIVTSVNQVGSFVFDMAFHPGGQYTYIARRNPNAVLVVDMNENGIDFGLVQAVIEIPGSAPTESPFSLQVAPDGNSIDVFTYALESGPATRSIFRYPLSNNGLSFGSPTQYSLPNGSVGGDYLERLRVSPRRDVGLIVSRTGGSMRLHSQANPSNQVNATGVFESLTRNEFEFTPDGSLVYFASVFHDSVRVYDFYESHALLWYLAVASGDNQTGVVNQQLPAAIRATTYGEGPSLTGLVMTFRVTGGGGSFVTAEGLAPEVHLLTDDDGFAEVQWKLGPVSGRQTIEVISEGLDGSPLTVVATAAVDPNTVPLALAEVLPLNLTSNVSVTTAVLTTFSRAVDPLSIGSGSLFIELAADATRVPATFGFTDGNRKVSLTPSAPLAYSSVFHVVYNGDIEDAGGGALSNPGQSTFTTQAPPPPTLASVAPPSALPGVSVILNGAGFDPVPANNEVLFNNVVAIPTSGTTARLDVVVPANAVSGTVAVRVGSTTSNARNFVVLEPNSSPIDEVIGSVNTGSSAKSCAVTPDGALCYTVSPDGDVVVPVDIDGQTSYPSIAVGDQPVAIVMHPDGTFAYVANFNSGSVSVIDVQPASVNFNKVVTTITVGVNPADLAILPDGNRLLVANAGSGDVSIVDGNESSASFHQVVGSAGTGTNAKSLAVSPDGARIYIGTIDGFVVLEASGYSVVGSASTGTSAKSLAVSPDGAILFILGTNGTILIVDVVPGSASENQVVGSAGTGTSAKSLAVSPDGTLLYVIQENSDEVLVISIAVIAGVSVIDPDAAAPAFRVETRLVHTVQVGADPSFVAIDPSGSGTVLVTNAGDKTLSIINSSPPPPLEARFEIFPPIIIWRLKTPYVTGWVQLPVGYAVRDIDVNTVRLNGTVPAIPSKVLYYDFNHDHIEDVLFTFKKPELLATLDPEEILQTVSISGDVADRTFTGEDWLIVLFPWLGLNNSGESLVIPDPSQSISWVTPDGYPADAVDIHVSWDGGETWDPVALQAPNTGAVAWDPPANPPARKGLVMVTLWQNGEVGPQGVSLRPFTLDAPAATQLESFDAVVEDGTAVLRWETAAEGNMDGFRVMRADAEEGTYAPVAEETIAAVGGVAGASYEYRDEAVRPNRTYWYKLQEVRGVGTGVEFGPYSLSYRLAFGLEQNMPNPFNPTTTIRYSLASDVKVSLVVYDVAGRRVRTLVNADQRADVYRVTWDGRNDTGARVASGMYFYKFVAGAFTQTKKMMLLK